MKIRLNPDVFIRQIDETSIFWRPNAGACSIIENVRWIVERLCEGWLDVDELVKDVAAEAAITEDEVRQDATQIIDELSGQHFVSICGCKGSFNDERNSCTATSLINNNLNPLNDYYTRAGLPSVFHIDLTDACTEKCVHCYVPRKQTNFLPYELVEKAIKEYRSLNGLTVHLAGGECMLHPDFRRIGSLCKELNLNLVILSNMTCCDEEMIEWLKGVAPQYINVSLYSTKPEEHDAITQLAGSWKKTINAIQACERAGVHCRIATPLLKINQKAFPELKVFANLHHMHLIPSIDIVARSNHDCGNLVHSCSAEEVRHVMQSNRQLFNRYDGVKMPHCDAKVCDIGVGRLYLNSQGHYYPCDSMHDYSLGDARKHTFEAVWRGDRLNYLRGLKNRDFGACASCENRPWCKVCPAANYNATRDLFSSPIGYCDLAKVAREIYERGE